LNSQLYATVPVGSIGVDGYTIALVACHSLPDLLGSFFFFAMLVAQACSSPEPEPKPHAFPHRAMMTLSVHHSYHTVTPVPLQ